jgi:hypothetical protein
MAWWQQPFIQIALPIIITFVVASWSQNKRIDEVSKRLDDIVQRLTRIESLLTDHDRRLTALEERTSPLRR